MLTIKIILWITIIVGSAGLLLLCLANRLKAELSQSEWTGSEGAPLAPTPPVSRQIEVLSKFNIGKDRSKWEHGERVLFLDPMRNGNGWTK